MGTLYLVRHGQASFGADDYDVLSSLGQRQSLRLGEYFRYKGVTFDAALTGTLKRQIQTFAGIREGMGESMDGAERSEAHAVTSVGARQFPAGPPQGKLAPSGGSAVREATSVGAHILWAGLNEYDSEAVIGAIHPQPLEKPSSPEMYRQHFRLLREGLRQWADGVIRPQGMPSYAAFVAGISAALDHIKTSYSGNVLLVSSGGPIATAVGQVLGLAPETTIELNLRIRNCSVTEFAFTPRRHMLVTYNTLPHLDAPEHADWITYS